MMNQVNKEFDRQFSVELNLDPDTGIITDGDGGIISLDEARKMWETGRVARTDRYFRSLIANGFDMEITKIKCEGW